ncbi:MAG: hypothetical protein IJF32_00840, partial [Oscillospiraceae bacterium]|nr:hypothetical protein [Oscillospiraceae bacterium]
MKMRKAISLILAICMLATLLPTIAFANGEAVAPIVADFACADTSITGAYSLDKVVPKGFTIDLNNSVSGNSVRNDGSYIRMQFYVANNSTTGYAWPRINENGFKFTINVTADKAGYYAPEFAYKASNYGAVFTMYVNGVAADEIDTYVLGKDKVTSEQKVPFNTVYLNEGVNEISFRLTKTYKRSADAEGKTEAAKYDGFWFYPRKLTFTPASETPVPVEFLHDLPVGICKGQSIDFSMRIKMSDGTIKYFGKYDNDGKEITDVPVALSVTSEIGEVKNVVRTTGGVSASFSSQNAGDATITARAMVNDETVEKSYSFTVLDAELGETKLVLPSSMYIGDSAELTTEDTLTNNELFDIPNTYTVYTSSDEQVAKIEGNTLTALKKGTTTITATTTFAGVIKTDTVEVAVSPVPLSFVSLSLDKSVLPATRETNAAISVLNTKNEAFTEEYSVLYESSDTNVATVEIGEDKNKATIIGVSPGIATIKVTITTDGVTVIDEEQITVTKAPVISDLVITTNKDSYKIGDTGTFAVSGVMSDGISANDEELASLSFTYENDNEKVISLNAEEKNFVVLAEGDAEISAVAEIDGEKLYGRKVIKVAAQGSAIVANFAATIVGDGNVLAGSTTDGFRIIEDKSSTRGARVALEGSGLQVNHWVSPATAGKTWPASKDKNLMFTISVESEKAGYYSPELIYEAYNKSGAFAIYVNKQFAGEIDAYAAKQTKGVQRTATLNSVYLDYGKNEISFRLVKSYPREDSGKYDGVWLILNRLTLTACAETLSPEAFVCSLPGRICAGELLDLAVSVKMSDGSTKLFGKYAEDGTEITDTPISLSLTNGEGEISDISSISDGVKGSFLAKAGGTVTITASATVDGDVLEKPIVFEILDEKLKTTRPEISGTVFKDDVIELKTVNTLTNGEVWDIPSSYTIFTSSDPETAKIEGNSLTALKAGTVAITATTTLAGVTQTGSIEITILDEDVKTLDLTAGGSRHIRLTNIEGDTVPMFVKGITNKGAEVEFAPGDAKITYEALNPEVATIDDNGIITPVEPGNAKFRVKAIFRGREITSEVTLACAKAKSHSTYYTEDKKANAIENISK